MAWEHGAPAGTEGVAFLDADDRKMVYVRSTGNILRLEESAVSRDAQFCFYDQIHTTGMDIKHALNARAALTLGKDMTFRDLAQGAFRMRGIGEGQTVAMVAIPEVQQLMSRQLAKAGYVGAAAADRGQSQLLRDVSAWLVVNSMRMERVQFDQLCHQNLAHVWRRNAFDQLLDDHKRFKVRDDAASGFVLDMLGEAFFSNREGATSRSALDGKVLGIYFQGTSGPSARLLKGLQLLYKKKGTPSQTGKEVGGA